MAGIIGPSRSGARSSTASTSALARAQVRRRRVAGSPPGARRWSRCSASTAVAGRIRVAAIRSAWTRARRAGRRSATRRPAVRATSVAQRRPLGVPAAVGAVVDRLRRRPGAAGASEGGCGERSPRTRTDSTGLALCGIVDEPPRPGALGELADLGPGQHQHVVGDPAPRVGRGDEGVAEPGDRRPVRVPGTRVELQDPSRLGLHRPGRLHRLGASPAGQLDDGGERAGRAAELLRELVRPASSRARRGPPSHCAALSPKVDRHGVLGQRARRPSRCRRCRRARAASAADLPVERPTRTARRRRVRISISAESTTSWLVSPRCSQEASRLAAPRAAATSSGMTGLPPASASARSRRGRPHPPARRGRCAPASARSRRRPAREPRRLDPHHGGEKGALSEDVAGPLVAGPEQVSHRRPAIGEEDGLVLALQPDVEHQPGRVVGAPPACRAGRPAATRAAGPRRAAGGRAGRRG